MERHICPQKHLFQQISCWQSQGSFVSLWGQVGEREEKFAPYSDHYIHKLSGSWLLLIVCIYLWRRLQATIAQYCSLLLHLDSELEKSLLAGGVFTLCRSSTSLHLDRQWKDKWQWRKDKKMASSRHKLHLLNKTTKCFFSFRMHWELQGFHITTDSS